jgi:hypothetical protein
MSEEQQDALAALWARYARLGELIEGLGALEAWGDALDQLEAMLTSPDVQQLCTDVLAEEGQGKARTPGLEYKALRLPYSVKALDDSSHTIWGYGAAWTEDLGHDVIEPGGFADTVMKAWDAGKGRGHQRCGRCCTNTTATGWWAYGPMRGRAPSDR